MKVLIVDDNPTNLRLLRALLEAEGLTIFDAGDGVEALEVLEREPMDAVISDVLMPRMDGFRLCLEVRKHERLKVLPFIIYTATYTSATDEKLSRDMGADIYLKKPAPAKAIMEALHELTKPTRDHAPEPIELPGELTLMKEYNERLVQKLEQKNAELEATHAELRQLLEHSPAVIYKLKVEARHVRLLVVSDNMERLLGVPTGSTTHDWWLENLYPEDQSRAVDTFNKGLTHGGHTMEYRLRHLDGSYRWIEDNMRIVRDVPDQPKEGVGVWTDISERKIAERTALRSQRLESIGTLAGGVAHDLNNALAPIMMGAEVLRMKYPKESEVIDLIQSSAKRGADMVRQLLTFAKGAEGERVFVQPSHIVKELQSMMRGSFPKNIQVRVNCDPLLPTVLGDATQLHQILLNLCVNARDAMPNGGTLVMEAQRLEVDAAHASASPDAKPGHYVMLRVRDTGTGIPPEILDRIFDPFFTTKGPDIGTGLGLSTVTGIVKGHGGFMQVTSQLGHGSTFTVYLPADGAGSETEQITKERVEFRGQEELIMFVDDEAPVREMARAVLRRLNFTPVTATDGVDGLIQAAEQRTKLRAIITDLHMPHMDGLTFVRAIRRMLPDIPIVVTSGRMDEAMAEEFKAVGVMSRLDKPFTEGQLAEVLRGFFAPK